MILKAIFYYFVTSILVGGLGSRLTVPSFDQKELLTTNIFQDFPKCQGKLFPRIQDIWLLIYFQGYCQCKN